jgi:hypothetical protein
MQKLAMLSRADINNLMTKPEPLHRFVDKMSDCFHSAIQRIASDATVEQVIYKAKALHPEFPGMMDLPSWEIGRNWRKPRVPECNACYMRDLCPTAAKDKKDGQQASGAYFLPAAAKKSAHP